MITMAVKNPGDDAATVLQAQIDLCARWGGGQVIVPVDEWRITRWPGVLMRSGVHLSFHPPAKLVRDGACNAPLFANGIEDFSVTGANIDINRTENFQGAISVEHCRNYRVEDCTLGSSVAVPYDDTIHAILAQDCDDGVIENIRTTRAQVKLTGARRTEVRRIRAEHARNYAVALVAVGGVGYGTIEDCIVEDVRANGYCAGALYLGCDSRTAAGTSMRRVEVRTIRADGPTSKAGRGVLFRKCAITEDIEISDVRSHHEYYPDFPGVDDPWSMGVAVVNVNDGTGSAKDVRIRDVRQRGRVLYGMEVHGPITGLVLTDIDLEVARRYIATAGSIACVETNVKGARENLVANGYTISTGSKAA